MVDFTNPIEEQAPPDLTRGYRTVDNSAIGDLFTNVGRTMDTAAKAYVVGQEKGAEAELEAYTEQIFSESGIEEEVLSPGLSRDQKKLAKLSKAAEAYSGNKGNLYAAKLASFVKDMRMKYPHADIDKIVAKVTGINPKEYLLKQYQNQLDNAEKNELARTKKWTDRVASKDPYASDLIAAFGGMPSPEQEAQAEKLWLKYQSEANIIAANTEKTEKNFKREAAFMFNKEITPVMAAIGNAGALLTTGGGLSRDQKDQLLGGIAQARAKIAQHRAVLMGKYGAEVDVKVQKETLDSYEAMLKSASEAVTKDDINAASFVASSFSWTQSEDTVRMMETHDELYTASMLVDAKVVDPAFMGTFLKLTAPGSENFQKLVEMNAIAKGENKGISAKNLMSVIKNQNASSVKQSATYRGAVQTVAQYLGDTGLSAEYLEPVVNRWLTEGTLGPAANELKKGGSDLIAFLSAPKIIDNIARTAPNTLPNVVKGVAEAITTNKEFQDEITDLRKYSENGKIMEDASGALVYVDNIRVPKPFETAASRTMQTKLGPLNKAISNLKYAVDKSGQSWDDYKSAIYLTLGIEGEQIEGTYGIFESPNEDDISLSTSSEIGLVWNDPSSSEKPRGIKNNNPGNIEFGSFTKSRGAIGSDGRFAKFETPEEGIRAMRDLLNVYQTKHGLRTPLEIISRWAPPGDNNPTSDYAARVARAMNLGITDPVDLSDPSQAAQFIAAMIKEENGKQLYDINAIEEALS
jgi:hypothetical protein